jgi:hypothetical protein
MWFNLAAARQKYKVEVVSRETAEKKGNRTNRSSMKYGRADAEGRLM